MTAPSDPLFTAMMRRACAEARRWLGSTSPNPAVGAVALDSAGAILAVDAHQRAGEAHAETRLLETCRAQGVLHQVAAVVVTLEPCNHRGHTPPCSEALIAAGVRRVFVGTRDPNPAVKGGGIERLRQAGVEVTCGVAESECRQLIHAFAYRVTEGKPWVTVKRAFDPNGSMIPAAGQKTFTSPDSLRLAHRLRKKADAILTGSGTVLADNPLFTVRHVADHPGKRRWLAILDRRRRVAASYLAEAQARGFDPIVYEDLEQALDDLKAKGAQDILVEAGPAVSLSVLNSDLWTMAVEVRKGSPDTVNVTFNACARLPFAAQACDLDLMLPD